MGLDYFGVLLLQVSKMPVQPHTQHSYSCALPLNGLLDSPRLFVAEDARNQPAHQCRFLASYVCVYPVNTAMWL